MAAEYEIPYTADGHLLDWPGYNRNVDWRENKPFEATMTLTGYGRGHSSATFNWEDEQGHRYSMFMKDTEELIMRSTLDKGILKGTWRGVKRGTNYGIQLVREEGN